MAFADPLTLNANASTGVSLAVDHAEIQRINGGSIRAAPSLANSTPQELDFKHQKVKRGRYTYIRSTAGLTRKGIIPTGGTSLDPELSHSARFVLERPTDGTAVPTTAIVKQWGELLSVFGTTLSTGGTPSANVAKFLNMEP